MGLKSWAKFRLAALAVLAGLVAYLTAWPVAIDPVAWQPPQAPALEGVYEVNDKLAAIERINVGGVGPEHATITPTGRIYTGLEDGRIMRAEADGTRLKELANTGGRPQTVAVMPDGTLLVADTYRGLLSIDTDGKIKVLLIEVDGVEMKFANDIAVSSAGTIYLTDSSSKFRQHELESDFIEHGGRGRLIAFTPSIGRARVLLDGLEFANGVALSQDESFLLVNETGAYRTIKYWLRGSRAGQHEVWIDNLPGFPDNIRCYDRGICWIALINRREPILDSLAPYPFMRKVIMRVPRGILPQPTEYAFVIGLDLDGNVIENLQDPSPNGFGAITGVTEHNGMLYLGNLDKTSIGRYRLGNDAD